MKHVHDLLHGKQPINADMAVRLESVLGGSAQFWLSRESQFQESRAREKAQLAWANEGPWVAELPVAEMTQRGWIPKGTTVPENVGNCLRFFGVSTVAAWKETYAHPIENRAALKRGKVNSSPGAAAAWLRRGELKAAEVETKEWNAAVLKERVPRLRELVRNHHPHDVLKKIEALCAEAGVAFVVVRAPKNCAISGATKFLSKDKAMVLLSFRGRSEDRAWFTFFHEIGHLLRHSKKLVFVDLDLDGEERDALEEEANAFALDVLIPPEHQKTLEYVNSASEIEKFAREIGISSGVVAGQVQHRERSYGRFHELIRKCSTLDEYD